MDSLKRHTDYGSQEFNEESVLADPIAQFSQWLSNAEDAEIFEPNAMVLSTIDPDGRPSSRTVLLKGLSRDGFEFVTNYSSRKAQALNAHSDVTLLFPWYSLKRQVIVYGSAARLSAEESDEYWNRRPQGAQLASAASKQSQPIASRELLDQQLERLEAQYPEGAVVPRPANWGAYRVTPRVIEFWQGRSRRFHDRLVFTREVNGNWSLQRLQP
ncbi:MAG: Pyridoxine/pyridoxamine 5-phosphate oxidase [Actinomycetota bacterium]